MENNSSILRKVIVTLFVVLCFILQCSVFNSLALGGIIPNLMIILTSSFGFMRGEKEGLLIGFFSGLLCDIFFGSFLGFYAMIMMYIVPSGRNACTLPSVSLSRPNSTLPS